MSTLWRPRRPAGEHGTITLLVIVLTFAVLAMIGLSVDGAGKIRALERADNLAAEAARAAGQAIAGPEAIPGGPKVVDPAAAITAGRHYLTAAGATGTVAPDRRHITVEVSIVYTTVFLGLIGITTLTATRHATATIVAT